MLKLPSIWSLYYELEQVLQSTCSEELIVRGTIQDEASRQHVFCVIIDGERKKLILYEVKGLHDFNERLQVYEEILSSKQSAKMLEEMREFSKRSELQIKTMLFYNYGDNRILV
ncbi:hypothetical protein HZH68_007288 [Vespula germanica]|uniref:Uncharacterized protein n=1 Tax=Vespula germanica TaxID=30212 RepID=A0A834K796_VESGE|nr:hypothetical protein HZH68_007288 [Vespula germanica]